MFMQAVVIEVQWGRLLVLDLDTRRNVIVNTPEARRFRSGELVNIWYSGVMTPSIPPQITALRIIPAQQDVFPPVLPPPVRPPVIFPPIFFPPAFPCRQCPPSMRPPFRPGFRPR